MVAVSLKKKKEKEKEERSHKIKRNTQHNQHGTNQREIIQKKETGRGRRGGKIIYKEERRLDRKDAEKEVEQSDREKWKERR